MDTMPKYRNTRYISVTIDTGFFCRIDSSDAVCKKGAMEYPDIFDLSDQKKYWNHCYDLWYRGETRYLVS
ncbi:hypothetical protein SCLCIDRAFT_1220818 [Scleroderma citrinum Foug A]|uniref:Uncharacterized protein n=1 Tax=Scleroderma citrinum Foug A TaxID=1036808 RepID=A0A0C3DIE8_9AGAM|nr:hypothetical protein SCLCIDRAFT_1220818 [Scleroderma citrinum Foug A]